MVYYSCYAQIMMLNPCKNINQDILLSLFGVFFFRSSFHMENWKLLLVALYFSPLTIKTHVFVFVLLFTTNPSKKKKRKEKKMLVCTHTKTKLDKKLPASLLSPTESGPLFLFELVDSFCMFYHCC